MYIRVLVFPEMEQHPLAGVRWYMGDKKAAVLSPPDYCTFQGKSCWTKEPPFGVPGLDYCRQSSRDIAAG